MTPKEACRCDQPETCPECRNRVLGEMYDEAGTSYRDALASEIEAVARALDRISTELAVIARSITYDKESRT